MSIQVELTRAARLEVLRGRNGNVRVVFFGQHPDGEELLVLHAHQFTSISQAYAYVNMLTEPAGYFARIEYAEGKAERLEERVRGLERDAHKADNECWPGEYDEAKRTQSEAALSEAQAMLVEKELELDIAKATVQALGVRLEATEAQADRFADRLAENEHQDALTTV